MRALTQFVLLLSLITITGSNSSGQQSGIPMGTPCCGPRNSSSLRDRALKTVEAVYPEYAKKKRIKGHVVVEITIDEKGRVISARPLYGHKSLRGAALAAAKQWEFQPVELNGQPVKVIGTITFNFPPREPSKEEKPQE